MLGVAAGSSCIRCFILCTYHIADKFLRGEEVRTRWRRLPGTRQNGVCKMITFERFQGGGVQNVDILMV